MRTWIITSLVMGALVLCPGQGHTQEKAPATKSTSTATNPSAGNAPSLRLRRLERRIQVLKENAWRAKARVGMLKESVLGGDVGTRSKIVHRNDMGAAFRLDRIVYSLDGHRIYSKSGPSLHRAKELKIFTGTLAPGNHTLGVFLTYKGHGYGVLSYLNGYRFTVRRTHSFVVKEDHSIQLTVVGYEQGDMRTKHEDRPSLDFKLRELPIATAKTKPKRASKAKK